MVKANTIAAVLSCLLSSPLTTHAMGNGNGNGNGNGPPGRQVGCNYWSVFAIDECNVAQNSSSASVALRFECTDNETPQVRIWPLKESCTGPSPFVYNLTDPEYDVPYNCSFTRNCAALSVQANVYLEAGCQDDVTAFTGDLALANGGCDNNFESDLSCSATGDVSGELCTNRTDVSVKFESGQCLTNDIEYEFGIEYVGCNGNRSDLATTEDPDGKESGTLGLWNSFYSAALIVSMLTVFHF